MKSKNQNLDLKGQKGLSGTMRWLYFPLIFFGGIRVTMHIIERFERSSQEGIAALITVAGIFLGVIAFTAIAVFAAEALFFARAKSASGASDLMLMNLSINSYQQAYRIVGKPVFLPKWDQGVYVSLRHNALELYAGFKA